MSATGNSNTDDFLDMLRSIIKVEPYLSSDQYGGPVFGPAVPYRCHVSNVTGYIRGPNGELIATKGKVWIACASSAINPKSRITLPGGGQPLILAVNGAQDETATDLYTRLDFG